MDIVEQFEKWADDYCLNDEPLTINSRRQDCLAAWKARQDEIDELRESLLWYVENDYTYEGGTWEEDNKFWLEGRRRAMKILGMK